MDPITYIGLGILIAIAAKALWDWLTHTPTYMSEGEEVTISGLEELNNKIEDALGELAEESDEHSVGDHLDSLEEKTDILTQRIEALRHSQSHDHRVQDLILDHFNLVHEKQEAQERLVKKSAK